MTKSNKKDTNLVKTSASDNTRQPSRRQAIKTLAATTTLAAVASTTPLFGRYGQVQSAEPIKIGFQVHRTGIGAAYGRWYD
ncbi:MAG: twin-arginine translocation signal domain-containing protein, partial [Alphaproteobacteria bacterium]